MKILKDKEIKGYLEFNLENEYLQELVKDKKTYYLLILVILNLVVIYNFYKIVNVFKSEIVASCIWLFFTSIPFLYVFRKDRKKLFKKVTLKAYMNTFVFVGISFLIACFSYIFLERIISIELVNHPITSKGYLSIIKRIPQVVIQILSENILYIGLLLMWYKLVGNIFRTSYVHLVISLLLSSGSFGMLHISTYDYNWLQCLFIVGLPSITHLISFLKYRNMHVGYLVHLNFNLIFMIGVPLLSN